MTKLKILFLCTSNKDRSPALAGFFKNTFPDHEYRSAGLNKYFCEQKKTHYLTEADVKWCDLIFFAEQVHYDIFVRDFDKLVNTGYIYEYAQNAHFEKKLAPWRKGWRILNCGHYEQGCVNDDYLAKADLVFQEAITDK